MITEDTAKPEKTVKVKVSDRWAVVHDGKRYVKGDTLTVPENVADEWERNRWVERIEIPPGRQEKFAKNASP